MLTLTDSIVYLHVFIIFPGSVGAFLGSLLTLLIRGSSKVITKNNRKQRDFQNDKYEMDNTNNKKGSSIVIESRFWNRISGWVSWPSFGKYTNANNDFQPKIAIGTNLATSTVMGMSGLAGHLINNEVDYLVLATMGPAAMLGGYIGARYTNRFSVQKHTFI